MRESCETAHQSETKLRGSTELRVYRGARIEFILLIVKILLLRDRYSVHEFERVAVIDQVRDYISDTTGLLLTFLLSFCALVLTAYIAEELEFK